MIPFEEIDSRLEGIGKDRPWLATSIRRSLETINGALAPAAAPHKRSKSLQGAISDAIEREESLRGPAQPRLAGVYEIRQTPEQSNRADLASRAVNATSLADFCLQAIIHRANEILDRGIDPCAIRDLVSLDPAENTVAFELPFLGAVAAGEPVSAPRDESIPVPRSYPEKHFVIEINGRSMEPDYPDGSRWIIDGRDKFTPKNGQVCVVSDGSGSYLKKWNSKRKVFESINPDFHDVLPGAEAILQGYPVAKL